MLSSICVFGAYHQYIEKKSFSSPVLLVLKCRWRVPLYANKKWIVLRVPFYFRSIWPHFARPLYKKNNKTYGDHSRSRQRNCKSFRLTKTVHRLQRCHSRLQWSSFVVAAEKVRRYVENSEKWTSWYNKNFVADNTLINRQLFSRNICLVSRKAQEEILSQVTKTKKYHCKIFVQ